MLNKEEILNRTDKGLKVFKHYITCEWRIGRNFLNPLYTDSKASCNIYLDSKNNCYRMKDFGNDEYSGDCFFLVGKMRNLDCRNSKDFIEILKTINHDLSLGISEADYTPQTKTAIKAIIEPEISPKKSKPYTAIQKSFSSKELAFWAKSGIKPDILKLYHICSLKEFKSERKDGTSFTITSTDKEPLFAYQNQYFTKIYRPFSDTRFLYGGTVSENYCFGLEQLPARGDTLFITGGEKDVLTLVAHGFSAICFNSETSNIPISIIQKLRHRFKHIVLLYDVDKTGLASSKKHFEQLSDLGLTVHRLLLPLEGTKNEKDITDYFSIGNTPESFIHLFIEHLETLYSETMAVLKPCEIDFNNPPNTSQMIISINNVPLGTEGNLFCVTGGEGTGKSNYTGSLIAGALAEKDSVIDTLGTKVQANTENKAVLLYDTEQSEAQLYKNVCNILKRSSTNKPDNFKAYCLTSMSRKERLQAIIQSMDKFYYEYGGIHIVVIDGIADLVRCANDEAESVALIDELYRLAGIYKTCIVCVLHFIPSGLKLRGHLGSELQRKAAGIISIEKDSEPSISVIKALKVRDGSPLDIPLIQFAWSKELGMHIYIGEKTKEEKEKRKESELLAVARTIFSLQARLSYMALCAELQKHLDVKERTAKNYIRFMKEKDIVVKANNTDDYMLGTPKN